MTKRRLIGEAELLAEIPGLTTRQLRELRHRRRIPFYAPSYRVRLYDAEAVLKALEFCEVQAKKEAP
jgi:hypothetical protein